MVDVGPTMGFGLEPFSNGKTAKTGRFKPGIGIGSGDATQGVMANGFEALLAGQISAPVVVPVVVSANSSGKQSAKNAIGGLAGSASLANANVQNQIILPSNQQGGVSLQEKSSTLLADTNPTLPQSGSDGGELGLLTPQDIALAMPAASTTIAPSTIVSSQQTAPLAKMDASAQQGPLASTAPAMAQSVPEIGALVIPAAIAPSIPASSQQTAPLAKMDASAQQAPLAPTASATAQSVPEIGALVIPAAIAPSIPASSVETAALTKINAGAPQAALGSTAPAMAQSAPEIGALNKPIPATMIAPAPSAPEVGAPSKVFEQPTQIANVDLLPQNETQVMGASAPNPKVPTAIPFAPFDFGANRSANPQVLTTQHGPAQIQSPTQQTANVWVPAPPANAFVALPKTMIATPTSSAIAVPTSGTPTIVDSVAHPLGIGLVSKSTLTNPSPTPTYQSKLPAASAIAETFGKAPQAPIASTDFSGLPTQLRSNPILVAHSVPGAQVGSPATPITQASTSPATTPFDVIQTAPTGPSNTGPSNTGLSKTGSEATTQPVIPAFTAGALAQSSNMVGENALVSPNGAAFMTLEGEPIIAQGALKQPVSAELVGVPASQQSQTLGTQTAPQGQALNSPVPSGSLNPIALTVPQDKTLPNIALDQKAVPTGAVQIETPRSAQNATSIPNAPTLETAAHPATQINPQIIPATGPRAKASLANPHAHKVAGMNEAGVSLPSLSVETGVKASAATANATPSPLALANFDGATTPSLTQFGAAPISQAMPQAIPAAPKAKLPQGIGEIKGVEKPIVADIFGFDMTLTGGPTGEATTTSAPSEAGARATPNLPAHIVPTLAATMARQLAGGVKEFSMRLDPPELGQVEVRLTVAADKKVRAVVSAERPEALADLVKSARELTQAIRDAGLNLEENGLSFDLNSQSGGQRQNNNDQAQTVRNLHSHQREPIVSIDQSIRENKKTENAVMQTWNRTRIAITA